MLTFFFGWISSLQGISNVTSAIGTGGMQTNVPGLNNKKILCEASRPLMRKRNVDGEMLGSGGNNEGGGDDEDLYINSDVEEIDHVALLENMTQGIDIKTQYGSSKAVLRPEYIMVLHEILNYNEPNISLDRALSHVNQTIEKSKLKVFNVCCSINNVNTLIQAFDVYDMYDHPHIGVEFENNVNATAVIRNIIFPVGNTDAFVRRADNLRNMNRFTLFRLMKNMPYGNIEPSEFSNMFITTYRKFDTVDNVIKAHALTPYLCIKFLENMLCLTRPYIRNEQNMLIYRRYPDAAVFEDSAKAVNAGMYLNNRVIKHISTISIGKRYTALALMETYLELDYHEKLRRFFYVRNEEYMWYIYHALFFRRIDLYRYTIERAYHLGRFLEKALRKGNMPTESTMQQMRNVITLPLFLLLDSYTQMYQLGPPQTLCSLKTCTNINQNKQPRLYDPTKQCMMYHTAMADMQVPLKDTDCDSFKSVCMKYLRTVFFGRNAKTKNLHHPEYNHVVERIAQWYKFICMRLRDIGNESVEDYESISELEKKHLEKKMNTSTVLGPNTKIMRNTMPTPSVYEAVDGKRPLQRPPPFTDPFDGYGVDASSGGPPYPASLSANTSIDSHGIPTQHQEERRRFKRNIRGDAATNIRLNLPTILTETLDPGNVNN
ncbi:hypothetical protein HPB48_022739 [Haemaphysalis longicornis]|uniref:Uncharacterized protein n=1 Tax=Haemaphysalis longicornis TaxID=44386 RepID=A0A9J6FPD3_HAELO|nr:hypothetical protein HPB48_022739 [Haemaphysalis longicornis]